MIGIVLPQPDGEIKLETRGIVEAINDYTYLLEKPFDNLDQLPDVILDFKILSVEGSRGKSVGRSAQDQT
jgi:hypothetical protein